MRRILIAGVVCAAALWACVEEPTAPARCPDFCPGNHLVAVESLFTDAISRDSVFQGYVLPANAGFLPAMAEGGIDSRPITRMVPFSSLRVRLDSADTATGAIVTDSMKLTIYFQRPDTASRNLRFSIYQLPDSIDSTTTLADLAPAFAGPPLRVVNVDSLLSLSGRRDSVTGDTVLVDGVSDSLSLGNHIVRLRLKFDSAHAPVPNLADTGRVSLGVLISADNGPTATFGAREIGAGLTMHWFYRVDSAGKLIRPDSVHYGTLADSIQIGTDFDTFVFTAPVIPLDSNLLIGGVPSRRSLLRINFPKNLRDSSQVIRAQLLLIPTATAPLLTSDSVIVVANRVAADFGLKSPMIGDTIMGVSAPFSGNPTDTVRIELTTLYRFWQFDTTQTTSIYLRLLALNRSQPVAGATVDTTGRLSSFEGATFTTLRFYSSRTAAFRPMIRLTYVPRINLGAP
ncbi:MAG TPA: hypothetical protein VL563_17605 [Gemmatimonadales bacterium]|nr:hypothetical protein [Gemmatimonadales bacterium]